MNSIFRQNKTALILIAAGAVLRLLYLCGFSQLENFTVAAGADISEYHARALEIVNGQYFPAAPEIHAPLYSFFLALLYHCGLGVVAARIIQTLLNFAAWIFLWHLTGVYKIQERSRLLFLGFAMIAVPPVFHAAELISESLLIPLFALCFGTFAYAEQKGKAAGYAGAGLCAGLAAATHGLSLAFLGMETCCFFRRKQWKNGALFLTGAALILIPLITAKTIHYKQLCGIQANSGFNIWLGNNAEANGKCYLRPGIRWNRLQRQAADEAVKRHISKDRLWIERCGNFLINHPFLELKLLATKALLIFSPTELPAGSDNRAIFCRSAVMQYGVFLSIFFLLAGVAGCFLWRQTAWIHPFLLMLGVIFAQLLTVSSGRYRLVMWPGILLSAALFVHWSLEQKKRIYLFAVLLVGMVLSLAANLPSPTPAEMIEAEQMLGEAAYLKRDLPRCKELLEKVANSPDALAPAHAANLLGSIAESEKNPALAVEYYRKAIKADPEEFEGWMNLANLAPPRYKEGLFQKAFQCAGPVPKAELCFNYALHCYQTRRAKSALQWCKRALHANPAYAPALNLYAIICILKKPPEYDRAVELLIRAVKADPKNADYRKNLTIAQKAAQKK